MSVEWCQWNDECKEFMTDGSWQIFYAQKDCMGLKENQELNLLFEKWR